MLNRLREKEFAMRVQVLDEAICISRCSNALEEDMNPFVLFVKKRFQNTKVMMTIVIKVFFKKNKDKNRTTKKLC